MTILWKIFCIIGVIFLLIWVVLYFAVVFVGSKKYPFEDEKNV